MDEALGGRQGGLGRVCLLVIVWPGLCPGPCNEKWQPQPLGLRLRDVLTHRCIASYNVIWGSWVLVQAQPLVNHPDVRVRTNCWVSGGQRRGVCMRGTQDWNPTGKDSDLSPSPPLPVNLSFRVGCAPVRRAQSQSGAWGWRRAFLFSPS